MPAVTVVVPTYRRLTHLDEALASLRAQTLADVEALVCDNGADPAVEAKIAALQDPRFRYVPRPQNVGLARNALLGFADARSPLVTKLDDDDAFEPDTLALLVAAFGRHPQIDVAFGRLRLVDGTGEVLHGLTAERDAGNGNDTAAEGLVEDLDAALTSSALGLACAVFRRDVLDARVPDSVDSAYDLHVLLLLAQEVRRHLATRVSVCVWGVCVGGGSE